jgi:hypothetical protein
MNQIMVGNGRAATSDFINPMFTTGLKQFYWAKLTAQFIYGTTHTPPGQYYLLLK